jgi:hypothetical protein
MIYTAYKILRHTALVSVIIIIIIIIIIIRFVFCPAVFFFFS